MILEILKGIDHNEHYLCRYLNFITSCDTKNRLLMPKVYDKHHICPKAKDLFPEFASFKEYPWNCAILTPREHLIAHKLLVKAYPNSIGAKLGLMIMLRGTSVNIRGLISNTVVVRDESGNYFRVSTSDPKYLSKELIHLSTGKATAVTKEGEIKVVLVSHFYEDDRLRGVAHGTATVKDCNNNYYRVPIDDPRILSGEFVGVTKGKTTVINNEGKYLSVPIDDSRIVNKEVTQINKGKVAVRDSQGRTFQTSTKDPRYLSGELVSASKGRKAPNLKLSDDIVLGLRSLYLSKSTEFDKNFILEVVRESDKSNISIKPVDQLKSKNHKLLNHDMLFCMYYGKKYGLPTTRIKDIVEGKSYKHLL